MSAPIPPSRLRTLKRGRKAPAGPAAEAPDPIEQRRARRRLLIGGLVVALALSAAYVWNEKRRAPRRTPVEVERIAKGLTASGLGLDRIAPNANGGWSILLDDGEVQWFKNPTKASAHLHPIRNMYIARRDPNVVVLDLHPTVFAIVLSGRRQGSTLELGTSPTSAEDIAEAVETAVRGSPAR